MVASHHRCAFLLCLKVFNFIDFNSILHCQTTQTVKTAASFAFELFGVGGGGGRNDNSDAYETSIESRRMPCVWQFDAYSDSYPIYFDIVVATCAWRIPIFQFQFHLCTRRTHTPETMRKRDLPNGSHRNDRTWCNSEGNDFNQKNRFNFTACCRRRRRRRLRSYVLTEQTTERTSLVSLLFWRLQKSLFVGCSCI